MNPVGDFKNTTVSMDAAFSQALTEGLFAQREDACMAETKRSKWSLEQIWRASRIFVLFILLGGLVQWWLKKDEREFWLSISGLAISIGIAGLIVDFVMLKQLMEHTGKYISERITAVHLPEKIRNEILKIVKTELVRHSYRKTYTFIRAEGGLEVETTTSWEVTNYGPNNTKYSPLHQDSAWLNPEVLYFTYHLKGKESQMVYEGERLRRLIKLEGGVPTIRGPEDVILRPRKDTCVVTFKARIRPPLHYSDITSMFATEDITVELTDKPDWLEEFNVHSSGGKTVTHSDGSYEWFCHGPFIDGQHINAVFKVRNEL